MSDDAALRAQFDALDAAAARAEAFVAMLKRHGQLNRRADVIYRCPSPKRCALARVYRTAAGDVVQVPRYKLSPAVNEATSSEAGRAANTEDGARRWREHSFMIGHALNVALNCDHTLQLVLTRERIAADLAAGAGEVVLAPADRDTPPQR